MSVDISLHNVSNSVNVETVIFVERGFVLTKLHFKNGDNEELEVSLFSPTKLSFVFRPDELYPGASLDTGQIKA